MVQHSSDSGFRDLFGPSSRRISPAAEGNSCPRTPSGSHLPTALPNRSPGEEVGHRSTQRVLGRSTFRTSVALERPSSAPRATRRSISSDPHPPEGASFSAPGFRYYDELPALDECAQSWDMAFKDTPGSDYVVGLVAGRKGADTYLIDRVKGQFSFTKTCHSVVTLSRRFPEAATILIEDAANGPAIIDALRGKVSGVIPVTPQGGKTARAQAVQPMVEAGNVYLPDPRPHGRLLPERAWVEDFIDQCAAFPQGAHDDDVDAFTQLLVRWQRPRQVMSLVW